MLIINQTILKAEPLIHLFSENSRECGARIGEQQVMGGSVYSYNLGTSKFWENMNTGENIGKDRKWKSVLAITRQFMPECPRMLRIFGIHLFSESRRMCGSAFTGINVEKKLTRAFRHNFQGRAG